MMNQELIENSFSIFFDQDEFRAFGNGIKFEVKVIDIIDRTTGAHLHVRSPCIGMGRTVDEAFGKSAAQAKLWAKAQR